MSVKSVVNLHTFKIRTPTYKLHTFNTITQHVRTPPDNEKKNFLSQAHSHTHAKHTFNRLTWIQR